jgi:hypothetical protein
MKKSAEKKIKAKRAAQETEQVDPIKNAIVKADTEVKPADMKQFIQTLDSQDEKFHSDVQTLTEVYNHNWKQEQKLHGMIDGAKKFNEEEVRVSRSEVADKLRPVVEKIVNILGENVSKRKLIYSFAYLLSYKGEDGGLYTIHNVTAIMKIYETKFGLPFAQVDGEKKPKKEHDDSKTTYSLKVEDQKLMDDVFNAYQTARESGTFKHLLLEIDNHYNLIEMQIVTI